MTDKSFHIRVPYGTELAEVGYHKEKRAFSFGLKDSIIDWAVDQFGYIPTMNVIIDGRDTHYSLGFRSERDAVLFKTFWC